MTDASAKTVGCMTAEKLLASLAAAGFARETPQVIPFVPPLLDDETKKQIASLDIAELVAFLERVQRLIAVYKARMNDPMFRENQEQQTRFKNFIIKLEALQAMAEDELLKR